MLNNTCPGVEKFNALLADTLPEAEQESLARHLEKCAACRQRLEALAGGAQLPLKLAQREEAARSPLLEQVMASLKRDTPHLAKPVADPLLTGAKLRYFGDYEILEELGRGGMGVVYRARQVSLNRFVAIKLILAGQLASESDVRRFRTEAEAAAMLDHPHIVPIYEIGEYEGRHYFSMKLVEGGPLSERIANERSGRSSVPFDIRHSAFVISQIARAVHYAHQRGVLHRDLKPSNILLDAQGQPHLTDFGLAKMLERDSGLTHSGAIMGTPNYLAPEVAAGKVKEVTTAADVYSLGAILYELLTGRPPFREETVAATLQKVLHAEPPPPRSLNAAVPRDLEVICLKALEKEPSRRYASAEALADDMDRFRRHEPISARATGLPERVLRWCRRKPALAALVVVFMAGFAGVLWQWSRAELNANAEVRQRQRAEATVQRTQLQRAEDFFGFGKPSVGLGYLARILRQDPSNRVAAERLLSALSHRNFALSAAPPIRHGTGVSFTRFSPDGLRVVTGSHDGAVCVWDSRTSTLLVGPMRHDAAILHAQFSPSGGRLVTASIDRTAKVWDAMTGAQVGKSLDHDGQVFFAEFSPDGKRVATASSDKTARVWDAQTGAPITPPLQFDRWVYWVHFSPDGQRVVAASDTMARLWDANTGEAVGSPLENPDGDDAIFYHPYWIYDAVQFSPDGTRVATGISGNDVRLCDARTGQLVAGPLKHGGRVIGLAFSPDGTRIATASRDRTARVWDSRTGQPLTEPLRHDDRVISCRFSADGRQLMTMGMNGVVRFWDVLREGRPLLAVGTPAVPPKVLCADLSSDGRLLVMAVGDGAAQLWDLREGAMPSVFSQSFTDGERNAHFATDGKRVVIALAHEARVWDVQTRQPLGLPMRNPNRYLAMDGAQFSPDGRAVVTFGLGTNVCVWDSVTGQPILPALAKGARKQAEFSPDGRYLVAISYASRGDGAGITLWSLPTGSRVAGPLVSDSREFAHFSPDSRQLVTATRGNLAMLWDLATGQPLQLTFQHEGTVLSARFSPDGRQLITASTDRSARVWDARTGNPVCPPLHHAGAVTEASFSPDGSRAITVCDDFSVHVWDVRTGLRIAEPIRHNGEIVSAFFDPAGLRVLTSSDDRTARLWDAQTGLPLTEPFQGAFFQEGAEFSPDGRWILAACPGNGIRLWEIAEAPLPAPPWLPDLAEAVAGVTADKAVQGSNSASALLQLKERILHSPEDDSYVRWAKWFFDDRETRRISPSSAITVPMYVQERIEENHSDSLREGIRFSPTSALAFARLARKLAGRDGASLPHARTDADWFSRYATNLAPNDGEVLQIRASVLERLGRAEREQPASRQP